MLALLRARFDVRAGNGRRYAVVEHVRNAAGFDASGTCDAIVMDLWPSSGLVLHGFEVKISRADWLRELRQPWKSERFLQLLDLWWVVAADDRIVLPSELPDGWGLLVARPEGSNPLPGDDIDLAQLAFDVPDTRPIADDLDPRPLRLVQRKAAARLHGGRPAWAADLDRPLTRTFTAALLRAATRQPTPE